MSLDVHVNTPTHFFINIAWESLSVNETSGKYLRGWIWEYLRKTRENLKLRKLMPVQLYITCSRIVGRLVVMCTIDIIKRGGAKM